MTVRRHMMPLTASTPIASQPRFIISKLFKPNIDRRGSIRPCDRTARRGICSTSLPQLYNSTVPCQDIPPPVRILCGCNAPCGYLKRFELFARLDNEGDACHCDAGRAGTQDFKPLPFLGYMVHPKVSEFVCLREIDDLQVFAST